MLIDSPIIKRVIDGRNGIIGSTGSVYAAAWWVDNNMSVVVDSSFPWDDGTLSLLKSIHVERNETV